MTFKNITAVLVIGLLGGCTTGAKLTAEQLASISSVAIHTTQQETPLNVEYQIQDSTVFIATPSLPTLLAGAVISHAMDAPKNYNNSLNAAIKLRAFNQLIEPFNSAQELEVDLEEVLINQGYKVSDRARTSINFKMKNCLSENTKTLQVQTDFQLLNSSGKSLHRGTVRVQYAVENSWNKEKLQTARRTAVQESAELIALDLTNRFTQGRRAAIPHTRGRKGFSKDMLVISTAGTASSYLRLMGNDGNLLSAGAESNEIHVSMFYGATGNCHQSI